MRRGDPCGRPRKDTARRVLTINHTASNLGRPQGSPLQNKNAGDSLEFPAFLFFICSNFHLRSTAHYLSYTVRGQIISSCDFVNSHAAAFQGFDVPVSRIVLFPAAVFNTPFYLLFVLFRDINYLAFYIPLNFLKQIRRQNLFCVSVTQADAPFNNKAKNTYANQTYKAERDQSSRFYRYVIPAVNRDK